MFKILIFLGAASTATMASVVSGTNIVLLGNGQPSYRLRVYQDADRTDYTDIAFDLAAGKLIFRGGNLDEGSDWYFANLNDSFSAVTIHRGDFEAFNQVGESYDGASGRIFLGVNTGKGFSASVPGREVFGWARLSNGPGGLVLLDSAVTYDSAGIVIGTAETIPEPATASLFAFAAFAAVSRRGRVSP